MKYIALLLTLLSVQANADSIHTFEISPLEGSRFGVDAITKDKVSAKQMVQLDARTGWVSATGWDTGVCELTSWTKATVVVTCLGTNNNKCFSSDTFLFMSEDKSARVIRIHKGGGQFNAFCTLSGTFTYSHVDAN
ncbi:hypothetical protein OPW41_17035 [Vibrio europaeus]|uniref:Uncharacterized protein n=1 Tax=Vibrio europaeus TaxID=300876 RepID=A0A178JD92_9VIBR|nr:hypothetical protein [Vibrio europaeus]MDC5707613.1 hypothetical protein [Vibrio europaeus]MDC5709859.1 hypothetical protein [Vibrio europaeus]MDC5716664.1 hypothetical protein [Vibrio europaeus]MDC5722715.1 hypothetical protein [Vibrio europaeus]MDC5726984.1 hypothetical protein [Vibrio europaeus]